MFEKIDYARLTLKRLAEVLEVELPQSLNRNLVCGRLLTQSVYVNPGDVVISAGWYPHTATVAEALDKGAAVVFCDKKTKEKFPQDEVIALDDPQEAVRKFEHWRTKNYSTKRIAITGSVGKTTTTGLINVVIANSFKTFTHHSASNSHGAVLRHVQQMNDSYEYWVQEIGGVQPNYVEGTAKFLQPDIVVLTNIGESHLNLYGTKENIFHDKGSLERYAKPGGAVVINGDDEILRNAKYTHRVVTCSLKDPTADYYGDRIHTDLDGVHFYVNCSEGSWPVHLNLYGDFNAYNALYAIAVGRLAGVEMERIIQLLKTYYPSGMRQNLNRVGGYPFLVDTFNAEPKTVLGSAETLAQMPRGKGRRIFATGHIDKLGKDSAKLHEQLGRDLAKLDLDIILLFAGDSKYIMKGLTEAGATNAILTNDRDELDNWLRRNLTRDDIVFYKSGQFEAALAKTVDHVYGTSFQNEQQYNNGTVVEKDGYKIRLRMDKIAEIEGYVGKETDLVLPSECDGHTVIRIAPKAFTQQRKLTSVVIPDTVVSIGQEAFYICPKLKSVKLPAGLRIIWKNAFNYCKALETVEIPAGTIHVDRHAFYDCLSLKTAVVPESVGFLGEDVFGTEGGGRPDGLTVLCPEGSYAQQYCREHSLPAETVLPAAEEQTEERPSPLDSVKKLFSLGKSEEK